MDNEATWRRELEAHLLELEPAPQEQLAQLLRESRAAWLLLLPAPTETRRALLVGDARSGTAAGLTRLGWHVTAWDPDPHHRDFAERRGHATGAPLTTLAALRLDQSFDLVLIEEPRRLTPSAAAALSRGTVALTTDNSLAYKRSSGARADFKTTHPLAFLRALLFERQGALGPQRRALTEATGAPARAAALYPDRRDFAFVVDLDRPGPTLQLGPKERANRLKTAAFAAGLFPHLTPSFGLWSSRAPTGDGRAEERKHEKRQTENHQLEERQIDHILRQLEDQLDIPAGSHAPEHLVATRGNTALVTTTAAWVVRIPLGHRSVDAAKQNAAHLARIRKRFPQLETPEPLFTGMLESSPDQALFVTVETRLDGLGAGQLAGNAPATRRLTAELGAALATLETQPPAALDEADLEALFGRRFRVVRQHCAHPGTAAALEALEDEIKAAARGLQIGRVVCHRDLRPKHVIATPTGPNAGHLIGLVDWSCLDESGPPLFDLFHFIASERASRPGASSKSVWHDLQDRTHLEAHEIAAIEAYKAALALPRAWYNVIARAWPALFGAMAEEHWAFSRPHWLRRLFGIGL